VYYKQQVHLEVKSEFPLLLKPQKSLQNSLPYSRLFGLLSRQENLKVKVEYGLELEITSNLIPV
jgi:hypothetical protein